MSTTTVSLVGLTFAATGLALAAGCTAVLPPAERPDTTPPQVSAMPPSQQGTGRVVIDVTDGPTDVYEVMTHQVVTRSWLGASYGEETSNNLLCTTPCATDLPFGRHVLSFPTLGGTRRVERDVLNVGPQPMVYRRRLGLNQPSGAGKALGIVGATFGGMSAVVGVVLLPVGLGTGEDGMTLAGAITLGVGGALLIAGILGIALDPHIIQSGSSVTFLLE